MSARGCIILEVRQQFQERPFIQERLTKIYPDGGSILGLFPSQQILGVIPCPQHRVVSRKVATAPPTSLGKEIKEPEAKSIVGDQKVGLEDASTKQEASQPSLAKFVSTSGRTVIIFTVHSISGSLFLDVLATEESLDSRRNLVSGEHSVALKVCGLPTKKSPMPRQQDVDSLLSGEALTLNVETDECQITFERTETRVSEEFQCEIQILDGLSLFLFQFVMDQSCLRSIFSPDL